MSVRGLAQRDRHRWRGLHKKDTLDAIDGLPRTAYIGAIVLSHLAARALAVYTMRTSGVVRKNMGYPASAWTVMGPLLVLRTITDLVARLRHASPRVRPIPNLSARRP